MGVAFNTIVAVESWLLPCYSLVMETSSASLCIVKVWIENWGVFFGWFFTIEASEPQIRTNYVHQNTSWIWKKGKKWFISDSSGATCAFVVHSWEKLIDSILLCLIVNIKRTDNLKKLIEQNLLTTYGNEIWQNCLCYLLVQLKRQQA